MKKYLVLIVFVCTMISIVKAQSEFTGRQYLREGIPLSWFKLETDTSGHYYSKGDVGYCELYKTPLTWKHRSDSIIELLIFYQEIPVTYNLKIHLDGREYWQSLDFLGVFHRMHTIEHEGVLYK